MSEPPAAATAGMYCKTCGCDLRGSAGAQPETWRCPRCGRGFIPGDPQTFRAHPLAAPWPRALGRKTKRGALVLLLLLGGLWGWLYWGWRQEQAVLAQVGCMPQDHWSSGSPRILGGAPGRWFHDHILASFVLERVGDVDLPKTATEADLLPLRQLPELETLSVRGPIGDAGLAALRKCPRLRVLALYSPRISAAGLATLRDLPRLESLALYEAPAAGLAGLEALPQLKNLFLDETPVTDADLVHLAPLGKLRVLNLPHTRVTDAGLVHLEKLTTLLLLDLTGTQVTPAGVARLKAARRGCWITGP